MGFSLLSPQSTGTWFNNRYLSGRVNKTEWGLNINRRRVTERIFCYPDMALHQTVGRNDRKWGRETEKEWHKRGKAVPVCKCVIKWLAGTVERYSETYRARDSDRQEWARQRDRGTLTMNKLLKTGFSWSKLHFLCVTVLWCVCRD